MKNHFSTLLGSPHSSFLPFQPTPRSIKISLHQLINDLLATLQPHAHNRNNVIHNGVPQGLCFIAEENQLAQTLWDLLRSALRTRQNERIHVLALIDDHHTTIAVRNTAHQFAVSISNTRLAR
jgi:signal transduction histidine kinase